jgi:hypothetical protein
MGVEPFVELELTEETEILGENPPPGHFAHDKTHITYSI